VLSADKFVPSLVREKILELRKARIQLDGRIAEHYEIPQKMGGNKP